jgi:hypothetical protein
MTCGTYAIFCRETNECLYVGQSSNIEYRWKMHIRYLRSKKHPQKGFSDWFHDRLCDLDLLIFKVLEECDDTDKAKNLSEIRWFNELKPSFYGKVPSKNNKWKHSKETKKKITQSVRSNLGLPPREDRICPWCRNSFRYAHTKDKFCSRACNASYNNALKNKLLPEKARELRKLMSVKEIAKLYNMTERAVYYKLKE